MSKVVVWNLVTLDGRFEGTEKWDLAFHERVWGPDFEKLSEQFMADAELLVFGRVTYEGMRDYWTTGGEEGPVKDFMNAKPKLVASRSLEGSDWTATEVTDDIVGTLADRKRTGSGTIYVFGSAELCDSLFAAGVIDEVVLGVVPVVLGAGTPFFKPGRHVDLRLVDARPTDKGGAILRYGVGAAAAA